MPHSGHGPLAAGARRPPAPSFSQISTFETSFSGELPCRPALPLNASMKFPCEGVPGYNTVQNYVPNICLAALALIGILRQPLLADAQSSSVSPAPAKTNNAANKYFIEGTNALRRGDISAARSAFEQAVKLNPHNAEARNALGTILLAQNDAAGAAAQFRE